MITDWTITEVVPRPFSENHYFKYQLIHTSGWKLAGPIEKGFGHLTNALWAHFKIRDDLPPNSFKGVVNAEVPTESLLALFPGATIDGEWVYLTDADMALIRLAAQ